MTNGRQLQSMQSISELFCLVRPRRTNVRTQSLIHSQFSAGATTLTGAAVSVLIKQCDASVFYQEKKVDLVKVLNFNKVSLH